MNAHQVLPDHQVRSKGQATVHPDGDAAFPTTIRDISPAGIGVLAPQQLVPGAFVRIDIHGHTAHGVVHSCLPQNDQFYLGITIDPDSSPEEPAA